MLSTTTTPINNSAASTDTGGCYYKKRWAETDAAIFKVRDLMKTLSSALAVIGPDDEHGCFGSAFVTVAQRLREGRLELTRLVSRQTRWLVLAEYDKANLLARSNVDDERLLEMVEKSSPDRVADIVRVAERVSRQARDVARKSRRHTDELERYLEMVAIESLVEAERWQAATFSQIDSHVASFIRRFGASDQKARMEEAGMYPVDDGKEEDVASEGDEIYFDAEEERSALDHVLA